MLQAYRSTCVISCPRFVQVNGSEQEMDSASCALGRMCGQAVSFFLLAFSLRSLYLAPFSGFGCLIHTL